MKTVKTIRMMAASKSRGILLFGKEEVKQI